MTTGGTVVLAVEGVSHTYPGRSALIFPECALMPGDTAALIGPSGSGKSTLLMLIAGLLELQTGRIEVAGEELAQLHGAARDRWRGRTIGILLQSFQLLPRLSVLENLTTAQYLAGNAVNIAAARDTLSALGILDLAEERPGRLSRGQIQRAAIARAVVNRPKLLLADEPTSSLDDQATDAALTLLLGENRRLGGALLIATHDSRVTARVPITHELRQRPGA
jgi:putative ABC transport system ATP-binding protein